MSIRAVAGAMIFCGNQTAPRGSGLSSLCVLRLYEEDEEEEERKEEGWPI